MAAPLRALHEFTRIHVAAGGTQHVHFIMDARDLSEVTTKEIELSPAVRTASPSEVDSREHLLRRRKAGF